MKTTYKIIFLLWCLLIAAGDCWISYKKHDYGVYLISYSVVLVVLYLIGNAIDEISLNQKNMQYKIWKFELSIAPRQFIDMPAYADILTVGVGDELNDDGSEYPDHPVIWAKAAVNDTVPERMVKREFSMVRTDEVYDTGTMIWKYLGTVELEMEEDQYWHYHIFEIKQRSN